MNKVICIKNIPKKYYLNKGDMYLVEPIVETKEGRRTRMNRLQSTEDIIRIISYDIYTLNKQHITYIQSKTFDSSFMTIESWRQKQLKEILK